MFVLDYLDLSTSAKTPKEIAKISIYTNSQMIDTCKQLSNEGFIIVRHEGKFESNKRTARKIQDDVFDRIRRSYETYLRKFAKSGAISIEADNSETRHYPLKSSIAAEPKSFQANYFGEVLIGEEDKHFLTRDNTLPAITDLSLRNLERLPIMLIKILWVAISDENKEYWKFTYDVFTILYDGTDREIMSIKLTIRILFHLVLSSEGPMPPLNFMKSITSSNDHTMEVLNNSKRIAAFVAYPALESFLKFKCDSDIEPDGTVRKDQTIRDYSPRNERDFYNKGDQCSSLRDLLIHFENNVADDLMKEQLEQLRGEISKLAEHPQSKIYGLIYQWRNTLSHEATTDVKFGVILNIICMIIWHDVRKRVDCSS